MRCHGGAGGGDVTITSEARAALPVAIIGAGPVGLAAAAHLAARGIAFTVLEAGDRAGAGIAAWGHVRLFSPWQYAIDDAAERLLTATGWEPPKATRVPYGRELVEEYLAPLSETSALGPHIRYGSKVMSVSRRGMDRTRTTGRREAPFVLRVQDDEGSSDVLARAVIDASGTTTTPNGMLASGVNPAASERLTGHVTGALPDALGADRARFAGKDVLVIGAGHSAANTLLSLASLAQQEPGMTITWAIRNQSPVRVFTAETDELEGRAVLGSRVARLVKQGRIRMLERYEVDDLQVRDDGRIDVIGRHADGDLTLTVDLVVPATGFRPDLDMLREIRLGLDEIVEAPRELAPLIDPNLHSCGSVPPHGVAELTHPEPDFYLAGMKSYGRAPTFLLLTGYEQVRSIADELAGDHAAAREVHLTLPETGVCSSGDPDGSGLACCSTPAASAPTRQPLQLLTRIPVGAHAS